MNWTPEQRLIIKSPAEKKVVIAAAGSGKTAVLCESARYVTENGVNPENIAIITYTNFVKNELLIRGLDPRMHISTLHSLATHILRMNDVPSSEYAGNFKKMLSLASRPGMKHNFTHVFVDEFQDICDDEYEFILSLNTPNRFFVGDYRQSIYQFKGGNVQILLDLIGNDDYEKFELSYNFRCGKNIISHSNKVLQYLDYPVNDITNVCAGVEYNGIIYQERAGARPYAKIVQILKTKTRGNYKDWMVLVRFNKDRESLEALFEREGIPCDTFRQSEITPELYEEIRQSNKVKILTIHSAKGLESENVIVYNQKMGGKDSSDVCIEYVSYTRARKQLFIVG